MNSNEIRDQLKNEISQNNVERVFEKLQEFKETGIIDVEIWNDVTLLSSRFNELKSEQRRGTIRTEELKVEKNSIINSLIQVLDEVNFERQNLPENEEESRKSKLMKLTPESFFVEIEKEFGDLIQGLLLFFENISDRIPQYKWQPEFTSRLLNIEKKWRNRRFSVAVMALMKSGKSTLLNSWVGLEYLPSASVAETMRIIRIRHNPKEKTGILIDGKEELGRGPNIVRSAIRNLNQGARDGQNPNSKEELLLQVNISALKEQNLSGYGFDILDTPGVNEFGVPHLQGKVKRLANDSDVIIYLLDYTKLDTKDEAEMFESLRGWRSELLRDFQKRLFFVVNKIDKSNRHDREKKMDRAKVKGHVKKSLKKIIGLDVERRDIVLISAEWALLGRVVKDGAASEEQLIDFKEILYGRKGKNVTDEMCLIDAPELLEDSGFTELEEKVLSVIYKNRSQIFFKSITDQVRKLLVEVENNLELSKATLQTNFKEVDHLKRKLSMIQSEITEYSLQIEGFKKKARLIVESKFRRFHDRITQTINDTFSETSGVSNNTSFWGYLTGSKQYILTETDPDLLEKRFQTIHNYVISTIHNDFDITWNNTLEELYGGYLLFRNDLEEKARPLMRKIESTINESLNIELNPIEVNYYMPSPTEFYRQSDHKLSELLDITEKSNMNWIERTINKFIKLLGFQGREELRSQEYKIRSKEYKEHLLSNLRPMIAESRNLISQIIEIKYMDTIKEAKSSLDEYAIRYMDIIGSELKTKLDGIINVKDRISNLEKDIEETTRLTEVNDACEELLMIKE